MLSLVFVLIGFASSIQAQNISANEFASPVNVTAVVSRAARWLLDERGADNTWGEFTPRAVVALALAEKEFPLPQQEWDLMTKQINILLSLELVKIGGAKTLGLSRLASFTNALYATCQDPQNFHGMDLVQELREQTSAALGNAARNFSLPAVFLPLCLAGRTEYQDMVHLARMYSFHESKADLRALEIVALGCVTHQGGFGGFNSYVDSFSRWFPTVSKFADVYTRALGFQALNVNGQVVDPSPLAQDQLDSGSFGSLLATYYAIPALLGKTVLSLRDARCGNRSMAAGRFADSAFSSSKSPPKVYFSVWIGEGDDRDAHTVTVANAANKTLFDVMNVAQERNPIFKFSYDETSQGKRVYSLAGMPNDVEREIYWTLYLVKGSPNGPDPRRLHPKQLVTAGIEHVYPTAEDHFVFWFRRKHQH